MKSGRKRVGITTYWDTPVNYGQVLQGYALMSVLKKLGYEPFIVRYTMQEVYVNKSIFQRIRDFIRYGMNFSKFFKRFYAVRENQVNRHFDEFKHKYMCFSNRIYSSFDSLQKNYQEAEVYITGSDQVWGEWGTANKKKTFLLDFLPPTVTRVAYAASFGRNSVNENEIDLFKEALSKFNAISVREKSGIEICKQLGISQDVQCVVDPTLLLTQQEWLHELQLTIDKQESHKIAVVYLMQNEYTTAIGHRVISLLKKEGYQVRYVSSAYYVDPKSNFSPTIEQWLSAILSADIVITSSFHGTLFSANFNTPFITLGNRGGGQGQNSRLYFLLDEIGLSTRLIDIFDKNRIYQLLNEQIDWSKTNAVFSDRRTYSFDFLRKGLL